MHSSERYLIFDDRDYMLLNTDKRNVLHQLSVAFIKIKQTNDFSPLFDLIEETSPSTAIHSRGVSVVARTLAQQAGLDEESTDLIALSGMLHDIGKITIPDTVLNKAGPLTEEERQIMRSHAEMTFGILTAFSVQPRVMRWCAFHHERLNGTGYPFGLSGAFLDTGCRIMSISDVFVAITENRIYRKGMSAEEALAVMAFMVEKDNLDGRLFGLLKQDISRFNDARRNAQQPRKNRFEAA